MLYVGVTNHVLRRVAEHGAGTGSVYTKRYSVHYLVLAEEYRTAWDAITREKEIKAWRRQKKVALIEAMNPEWADLAEGARPW